MTKQLFGTDGIRGVPGEVPLDDATLDRVGLALGEYVSSHGRSADAPARVLIGRDTRESGPHIADRIARGLAAAGVEAVSAGVLTTPGVAWLVHHEGFAAGVVISASHNPYHDNGVKLISVDGYEISGRGGSGAGAIYSRFQRIAGIARRDAAALTTRRLTMTIWMVCARRCCRARILRG